MPETCTPLNLYQRCLKSEVDTPNKNKIFIENQLHFHKTLLCISHGSLFFD